MEKGLKKTQNSNLRIVFVAGSKRAVLKDQARSMINGIIVNLDDKEADLLNEKLEKLRD